MKKTSSLRLPKDRRGQMPFSMVAVVLIVISSFSAVLLTDLRDSSEQVGLAIEEVEEMGRLSEEGGHRVEDLSLQALLTTCAVGSLNESSMVSTFRKELDRAVQNAFPLVRSGYLVEANASMVHLSFLRYPMAEAESECGYAGSFVPAYAGLCGTVQIKVSSENGDLTRTHNIENTAKVPWPLLMDRMQKFERSVSDGLGTLSSITNYLLSSLATYRALQGWGDAGACPSKGMGGMVTEMDVINAIDLGLVFLQYETFRNAVPCYGMCTLHMNGTECWEYVEKVLSSGGAIDPADVLLRMYGYDEVDWREIFSQVLYDSQDRILLRWLEWTGVIEVTNFFEGAIESVYYSVNDIIDDWFGVDRAEEQFKGWLEDRFEDAGVPDTLYRYLGAGGPEDFIDTPRHQMALLDEDGSNVMVTLDGFINTDIPRTDVLEWEGWGSFHEQYKKGTKEILNAMRTRLSATADDISRNMFVPSTALVLDPLDGTGFLEEMRQALDDALLHQDEWIRPALIAAERESATIDPLAEAAKTEFLQNRDDILARDTSLCSLVSSCAEQLMKDVLEENPGLELPWDENVMMIEQAIRGEDGWGMMGEIEAVFERHASRLENNFLMGLNFRHEISGHTDNIIADIITSSGDLMAGLGAVLADDARSLLEEMSHALALQGAGLELELPEETCFTMKDEAGRTYQETLEVTLVYPTIGGAGNNVHIEIVDPLSNVGNGGQYPQLHDTNVIKMKRASFQSVWRLDYSGHVKVDLAPGGGVACLQMIIQDNVTASASHDMAVLTGHPLVGVDYHNINTMGQQLAEMVESVLRPLLDAIETISSGLRDVYRMLQDAVSRLLDASTKALELLSSTLQTLVESVQRCIGETLSGLKAKAIDKAVELLGERSFSLNFMGVSITICINPRELSLQGTGVPASFSMGFAAAGCTIDVTTRLIGSVTDYSLLTNATLLSDDWSAHVVIDPFMSVFRHMVEVRGSVGGCLIELVMPELVSYREISFALSDIPGVGALLSNIPTPIPGLKGCVDAGIYIKLMEGRTDSVVINEFELNPAGEDRGREWVELFNPTSDAIDLTGWTLQTTHGAQALAEVTGLLMPGGRLVYQFTDQALDNVGSGFPAEDSIVLRDSHGRRVDSTPFATDCWNDGRTWQRAKDGADRWEFREGTKGHSNGMDILAMFDMNEVQRAFASSVSESIFQLSSGEQNMEALAVALSSTVRHMVERLAADLLSKEVEAGLFVEVAATEASSTVKAGLRMEASLRCGTLGEVLDRLALSVSSLTSAFGNPFQMDGPSSAQEVWVGISYFGSIGVPGMISVPGVDMEVRYRTSLDMNIEALSICLGQRNEGWAVEIGAAICGVPGQALGFLNVAAGATVDVWLCKIRIQGVPD